MIIISEYPKSAFMWHDLVEPLVFLKKFPKIDKRVEQIFDNLIAVNSNFYDDKQEWLKNRIKFIIMVNKKMSEIPDVSFEMVEKMIIYANVIRKFNLKIKIVV